MILARPFQPAHRLLLVAYLALALLVVQVLQVHIHTFAGHEPLHGHDHAVELHFGSTLADSGHDDPGNDTALAAPVLFKFKQVTGNDIVALFAFAILVIVLAHDASAWSIHRTPPVVRGNRRSPPLRAPPR